MTSGAAILLLIVVVVCVGSLLLVRQSRRLRSGLGSLPEDEVEIPNADLPEEL